MNQQEEGADGHGLRFGVGCARRSASSPTNSRFMKIATWNVNSVRARLDRLLAWLKRTQPDIVCLQELKAKEEAFP